MKHSRGVFSLFRRFAPSIFALFPLGEGDKDKSPAFTGSPHDQEVL